MKNVAIEISQNSKDSLQIFFFNKVADLELAILLEKRLRWFSVNFAKFLRTPFLQKTSRRLLLYSGTYVCVSKR